MRAPVVVAKGADLIAAQIRNVAGQHDVTIVSAPPLARALYASTDIDREIPGVLYVAVATVLAYVYQLRAACENGWMPPEQPDNLPIPEELSNALKPDRASE
jgi:flagellar biosynthetic protein FlhB